MDFAVVHAQHKGMIKWLLIYDIWAKKEANVPGLYVGQVDSK